MYFSQLCRPLPCVPAQSTSGPARSTSKASLGSTLEREAEPAKPANTGSKWNVVRRFVVHSVLSILKVNDFSSVESDTLDTISLCGGLLVDAS
jgi:hypothetical protein